MKFVCVKNCQAQYIKGNTVYTFNVGETFTYNYNKHFKEMNHSIYRSGVDTGYNGYVNSHFIDENFITAKDFQEELRRVDQWFDMFLRSNVRITKIKNENILK
jgi:hypothetical protein